MLEQTIDRRRRSIIQLFAASLGGLSVGTTMAIGSPDQRTATEPMRADPPDSPATGFRIEQADSVTEVYRNGNDIPSYRGSATDAIQRAVDHGESSDDGTILSVSPGTYEIDASITLASSTWLGGGGSATTLKAAPTLDDDILRLPPGTEHVGITRLRLDGNRDENSQGAAIHVAGGAWRPIFEHLIVRDGADAGIRFSGGHDDEYSYEPVLLDVDVARCGGDGFEFGYTGDLFGANVYAESCEGYGFTMADAGGTVVHPHAYDTRGQAGIRILRSAKDLNLVGAHAEGNHRHGILVKGERISVKNAFIANNSRERPGEYDGVVLDGATDCLVSHSSLVNDRDREQTQGHGLVETGGSRGTLITENLFRHNTHAPVDRPTATSDCAYRGNRGYRTENGGEVTVSNGDRIPHDLDCRPTQYRADSTHAPVRSIVVDVDETALSVELRSDGTGEPFEGSVDVVWEASSA